MPITINGNGTITGYTPPIADGSITSAKLASGAITSTSLPSGTAIQIVNHTTTNRFNQQVNGATDITATSGAEYTSFNFTPKLASSKLLLTSSTFIFGERTNSSDGHVAFATYGGDTIIGSVCNYAGYDHWTGALDTTFVSFNHLFDSWGTSQKAISIRVQFNGSNPYTAVNYPTGSNTYAAQFNSPNRHQVTFTMTEFRA